MSEPTPNETRSTRRLIGQLRDNVKNLVAYEISQAKHEVVAGVKQQLSGAVLLVVAAGLTLISLLFFSVAAAVALTQVMPDWAAWLTVAGTTLLLAVIFVVIGKKRVARTPSATTAVNDAKRAFSTLSHSVTQQKTDV